MNEPKPLASLSGNLLARKGAARPAMRPQVQRQAAEEEVQQLSGQLEDLGWNDMGENDGTLRHVEFLPLTPAPVSPEGLADARADDRAAAAQLARNVQNLSGNFSEHFTGPVSAPKPEVLRQQDRLVEKLAAPAKPVTRLVRPRRPAMDEGRRAAFTLRLDNDRHLKLRLASTIQGRSAQQLVTRALDLLLNDMPEIQLLAAQVKRRGPDSAN